MAFDPRNLSQADQQQMVRYQQVAQSLDAITKQRAQMESKMKQTDFAIEELEKGGSDANVYRSIGGIFIKSNQEKVLEETKEEKESLEMRLKSLNMQEERLKKQYEDLTNKIKNIMNKSNQ